MSFKVIEYTGPLFRAEQFKGMNNTSANQHYNQTIPYHFFTTVKSEVEPYRKYGTTYTKTWQADEPLLLLDIMDLSTRQLLEQNINKNKLKTAFPIIGNNVYRISDEETDHIDRAILKEICSLQHNGRPVDGYYMKKQTAPLPQNISPFHSEIGLCRRAFNKLMLRASEKKIQPKRMVRATKKRNIENNSNNRGRASVPKINMFVSPTRKQKRNMFNNSNNNNNNAPHTPVGKKTLSLLNFQTP